MNGDFVPRDDNVARPFQEARARSWGFAELDTHALTVESSGNDVTHGPFAFRQMTTGQLLSLGAAVGVGVLGALF